MAEDTLTDGDANNGKKPCIFLIDYSGFMVEFGDKFRRPMSGIEQNDPMNGCIPVNLDCHPVVILRHSIVPGIR